ncbi:MAG TPA: hypothetical protein VGX95_08855 [Xanthobacteraceae bacterium]|nr:hypothetical protein [Xanthobacteraceae bacterium]
MSGEMPDMKSLGFSAMSSRRKPASKPVERVRGLSNEDERMVLSGADRDVFLAAIKREPKPARRLVKALERYRRLFG